MKPQQINILIACEESQAIANEFRKLGFNAFSCDLQPCSGGHPEYHIWEDVTQVITTKTFFTEGNRLSPICVPRWDMIIAHPPCTYLTVTGNRWFNVEKYGDKAIQRMRDREEAVSFFSFFTTLDCPMVAIENPVGIMSTRYRKADQIIQPFYFGDPYEKKTCLWLKGLPKLNPTNVVVPEPREVYPSGKSLPYWFAHSSGKDRSKIRSKTFPGIAQAIALQWGMHIMKEMNTL